MSRKPLFLGGGAVAVVLVFVVAVLIIDARRGETIADGTRIGSVDVGGLDRVEALERVGDQLGTGPKAVEVTYRGRSFELTPKQAGARFDVTSSVDEALRRSREGTNPFGRVLTGMDSVGTIDPRAAVSEREIRRFVNRVGREVRREPRNARISWNGGDLQTVAGRSGTAIKRTPLLASIKKAMLDPSDGERRFAADTARLAPEKTVADLKKDYPAVITIDRDAKRLKLYRNLAMSKTYKVAVGKEGNETTPGEYRIQSKQTNPVWNVPNSDWAGSLAGQTIPGGDPRNPLVARWMGFNGSQGIHGTSDIASLGSTASHGCIRMNPDDVKDLYDRVDTGSPVFVQ